MWKKIIKKLKNKKVRAGVIVAIVAIVAAFGVQNPDQLQNILEAISNLIDLFA